jgi:anthranilate phosphoribosyltransferase
MSIPSFSPFLKQIMAGQELDRSQASELMAGWLEGIVPAELSGAILVALQYRGVSSKELAGMAEVLLAQSAQQQRVDLELPRPLLDTCGTGGDGAGTFNISTAVALVTSAGGVAVAKHGNRAVSSRSGSADVLEALGVNLGADLSQICAAVREVGLTFLFAPHWHPAMKGVAPLRKSLGIRTVFNLLGPLVNPCNPDVQIVGVYASNLVPVVAEALALLGRPKAIALYSREGLDEISLADKTDIAQVTAGHLQIGEVDPRAFGINPAGLDALRGGDVVHNAEILTQVLQGKGTQAQQDCVALNSAYAFYLSGKCADPHAGFGLARDILQSGAGWDKLVALRNFLAK